jgi:hypothetical protein
MLESSKEQIHKLSLAPFNFIEPRSTKRRPTTPHPIATPQPAMSSSILPRLALRQSRVVVQRRAASTTTGAAEAASKGASAAKETAQNTASKAQQGLSRVTSSAGPALSKAASAAQNTLSNVGGRTGAVISWVQGMDTAPSSMQALKPLKPY